MPRRRFNRYAGGVPRNQNAAAEPTRLLSQSDGDDPNAHTVVKVDAQVPCPRRQPRRAVIEDARAGIQRFFRCASPREPIHNDSSYSEMGFGMNPLGGVSVPALGTVPDYRDATCARGPRRLTTLPLPEDSPCWSASLAHYDSARPRRRVHNPRAARTKVKPPSPPSAQSVQTKK